MPRYQQYKKYKLTRCSWLKEIPEHWDYKRIKNVATYNDDVLDEQTPPDFEITYVDISSVTLTNGIEKTETMIFEKAPSRARRKVKDGDVIVSTVRTYLKAIAPISNPPENMIVSTGFAVIRPNKIFDSTFAGYLLQSDGFVGEVVANSVGVSYPAINASDLVRISAIEPPLDEQHTIATFLDFKTAQIDALISKQKILLDKLAEKRTALISHAVTKGVEPSVSMKDSAVEWLGEIPSTWNVTRLRFLVKMSGGMTPSTNKPEYWGGEIPWVSPKDMKSDTINSSIDTLTEQALLDTSISLYEPNNVLIVVRGMILAHTFPVAINTVPVTVNQDMKVLNTSFNPEYLSYLLKGIQGLVLSVVEESAHGTKVLRTDVFKNIYLPVPSREEQERIVKKIREFTFLIDQQINRISLLIVRLQEYRSTLITNAVTGKIDVRNFSIPENCESQRTECA
ncbi:restriction endonuclease subunit S [Klebsiella grimontii]|uniref:restriction endonuclease subunit S n=1 Tax=Klebsiella grimontii TaxID=2058152 RepID=UPI0012B974C2|nr:restriction endonuclease subunit S [Klebsiella grimontii]